MSSKIQKILLFPIVSVLLVLCCCGKVTQEIPQEKKQKVFNITFKVNNILEKTDALEKGVTPNFFINTPVYAFIKGYKQKNSKQISWGKGYVTRILTPIKTDVPAKSVAIRGNQDKNVMNLTASSQVSANKQTNANKSEKLVKPIITYDVHAFNIKGQKISAAQLPNEIKSNFDSSKFEWSFLGKNIEKIYDFYLLGVFSNKDDVVMKIVSQDFVSNNSKINIDPITEFDTFQSMLKLTFFQTYDFEPLAFEMIDDFYDLEFFSQVNYTFPKNSVKSFNVKKPSYMFSNATIKTLLIIVDLAISDRDSAKEYITKSKLDFPKVVTDKLILKIDQFSSS